MYRFNGRLVSWCRGSDFKNEEYYLIHDSGKYKLHIVNHNGSSEITNLTSKEAADYLQYGLSDEIPSKNSYIYKREFHPELLPKLEILPVCESAEFIDDIL